MSLMSPALADGFFTVPGILQARTLEWVAIAFYEFLNFDAPLFPGRTSGKEPVCQCRRRKKREFE